MKEFILKHKNVIRDFFLALLTLSGSFVLVIILQNFIDTRSLIPMIFVLGVFIISLKTNGYVFGIASSLCSVLLVNYAFTYPYYAIDLISPECVSSAIVMLIVSVMTSTLTTKIKEQEKLKSESEKERMRANLLRAVSHDLRTPLTSVYGSCSAIIENYDYIEKEKQLKLLSEMKEDSEWLIRMVENLLSVTRIDGENVRIAKTSTVLEELIDSVLVKFRKRCPSQDVTINIPDEFISIPMDAMLIEQVLINLLENSVNHAKGMTDLKLTVTTEDNKVVFNISDNGCGISPVVMKNLFTGCPDRENFPTDGTRNNMGIGLSVCSAIIKAHGGEIYAKNLPSGGAAFIFSLALENENEQ